MKIYIAPSKALVQEKLRDWTQKFGSLGINCLELTGDNEFYNTRTIQEADIILTTPEVSMQWYEELPFRHYFKKEQKSSMQVNTIQNCRYAHTDACMHAYAGLKWRMPCYNCLALAAYFKPSCSHWKFFDSAVCFTIFIFSTIQNHFALFFLIWPLLTVHVYTFLKFLKIHIAFKLFLFRFLLNSPVLVLFDQYLWKMIECTFYSFI